MCLYKIINVEVSTVIGLAEEYKHLVGATHSDDADFHSVVKLVQQGYKMRRSDWEKGFVNNARQKTKMQSMVKI
ncbi:unnamed protein product [Brassica napus]|uniref:(rape) hypothetical protein n=1 Tax=Brassica napus TaxID=3708 RepID=A0A816TE16_BRANA|nr:unnamed protein product [Brassica napus]CAF2153537.1 unnamed protein product [Brassica napus]